ncbi:hypothetical protein [Mastigocladopsis repens]|uniref:hypothetical protein n=1 Tax=Mastigocladopsis repens TaxID=221287 RepID=UPI001E5B671F|nr:hypothetical protein [Mastigocladopsis repens]
MAILIQNCTTCSVVYVILSGAKRNVSAKRTLRANAQRVPLGLRISEILRYTPFRTLREAAEASTV